MQHISISPIDITIVLVYIVGIAVWGLMYTEAIQVFLLMLGTVFLTYFALKPYQHANGMISGNVIAGKSVWIL